mgnify:CR=1 FL=1
MVLVIDCMLGATWVVMAWGIWGAMREGEQHSHVCVRTVSVDGCTCTLKSKNVPHFLGAGCGWFCWQGCTCAVESQRQGVGMRGCEARTAPPRVCYSYIHGGALAFGISSDDVWLRFVVWAQGLEGACIAVLSFEAADLRSCALQEVCERLQVGAHPRRRP